MRRKSEYSLSAWPRSREEARWLPSNWTRSLMWDESIKYHIACMSLLGSISQPCTADSSPQIQALTKLVDRDIARSRSIFSKELRRLSSMSQPSWGWTLPNALGRKHLRSASSRDWCSMCLANSFRKWIQEWAARSSSAYVPVADSHTKAIASFCWTSEPVRT